MQHSCRESASQEDDPLDAFMAELRDVEKQPEPAVPDKKRKADVALDEEADNVADFMEVRKSCLPYMAHRRLLLQMHVASAALVI